jgi:hypothetical protein
MNLPVRTIIKELGLSAVAREMNLPVSTLHRWMDEDRIPGRSVAHRWRVQLFEAAVARLRARRALTNTGRRIGAAVAVGAAGRAAGPGGGEG